MLRLFGTPHIAGHERSQGKLPAKSYLAAALLELKYSGMVERHVLATALWENSSEILANRSLRQLLVLVRTWEAEAGLRIFATGPRSIARGAGELGSDLAEFLQIGTIETRSQLARLSSLYAGDFLLGVSDISSDTQDWIGSQRARLRDRFVRLALAGAERFGGEEADEILHRLADEAPYDDAIQRALMVHLAQERSAGAVRSAYEAFTNRLRRDLGTAPEIETRAILAELVPSAAPVRGGDLAASWAGNLSAAAPATFSSVPRLLILAPARTAYRFERVDELLGASLIDDVTFSLSRLRSFAVFAPHTARQLVTGRPLAGGAPYGADYVLGTRLLPGRGSALRLGISLTRTATQEVIFGDELGFSRADLPSRHADLIGALVGKLASGIERSELAKYRSTGEASAYAHFLLGREQLQTIELENLRRARRHFRRAAQLSPDFAPVLSITARTLCLEWVLLDRADKEPVEMAGALARRAIEIDPLDPAGHQELGRAALYRGALDEALEHLGSAVSRGPNYADILANYADALIHNSTSMHQAKRTMDEALGLNPLAPDEYFWISATAEFFLGEYAAASAKLSRMQRPEAAARFIAAVAALNGDGQTATRYRKIFLSRHPEFRIADWQMPLRDKADKERYVEAMRLAGFH